MDQIFQMGSLWTALASMGAASLVWWLRERRLTRLRQRIASVYALSEEVLTARTGAAVEQALAAALPPLAGEARVCVWLAEQGGAALEPASGRGARLSGEAAGDARLRCLAAGAIEREEQGAGLLLALPMRSEGKTAGVLELNWSVRPRRIAVDELAAWAHLANQAAIALRLIDQRLLREQAMRGERLGAVGQLLAGVAAELQEPVEEVARLAQRFEEGAPAPEAVRALKEWSGVASQALDRLVAFGRPGASPPRPVDLSELLRRMAGFRERSWRLRQVEAKVEAAAPVMVMGSYGQLEQALLSVVLRAEELLPAKEGRRRLLVLAQARGGRARVDVRFAVEAAPDDWGLGVAQGIAGHHGGALRITTEGGEACCEFDFPLLTGGEETAAPAREPERPMTLLVLTADPPDRRKLADLLAARGHRVVPAASGDEALALCARFRFDAMLAAAAAAGGDWVRLHERARSHVPAFVLMPDDSQPAMLHGTPAGVLVLRRPLDEAGVARVLGEAARLSPAAGA